MGKQVKNILFQIGSCAGYRVDFILPDHLGKGYADFGGAHCTAHGYHYLSSLIEVPDEGFGGVNYKSGVEMAKITFDKLLDQLKMRISMSLII